MTDRLFERRWGLWLFAALGAGAVLVMEGYHRSTMPGPLSLYSGLLLVASMVGGVRLGLVVLAAAEVHTALAYWLPTPLRAPNGSASEMGVMLLVGGGLVLCGVAINQWQRRQVATAETARDVLTAFMDSLSVGLLVVNQQGKAYYANQHARKLLGEGFGSQPKGSEVPDVYLGYHAGTREIYPREELPGRLALLGKRLEIDDLEVERPDGSRTLLHVAGAPVLNGDGQPIYGVSTFWDITRQRAAEVERREREHRLRSIFLAMAEGIVLQDAQGRIIESNLAAQHILGLSQDELHGRTSLDERWRSIHDDGSPYPGDRHPAVVTLATGLPIQDDVMGVHRPDGSLVWLSVNTQPLIAQGEERPYAVVVSFADVTETRHALADQRDATRRLSAIIEASPAAIYTVGDGYIIQTWNHAAERIFGWQAEEVIGKPVPWLTHISEGQWSALEVASQQGIALNGMEVSRPRKDGEVIDISLSVAPLGGPADGSISVAEDITARKRAETALRAANERLSALIDAAPLAIYGTDSSNGNVTLWNPAAEQLFGWSEEEVVGGQLPMVPPETEPQRVEFRALLQRGEAVRGVDAERLRKDGRRIQVRLAIAPVPNPDGSGVEFIAFGEDVTERLRAEQELMESREQYRQLVDLASDIVFRTDINGHFTYVNPVATRIVGYQPEELVGTRFSDIIHPEYRRSTSRFYMRQFLTLQRTSYLEFPMIRKDGQVRWMGQSVDLNLDEHGRPAGFQAICRDVTERREAQEALAREYQVAEDARAELRSVLDGALAAMILIAPDHRIRATNRVFDQTFAGLTPDDWMGARLDELSSVFDEAFEDGARLHRWMLHALDAPSESTPLEMQQRVPEQRSLTVMAGPVTSAQGSWLGQLFVFRDVTQERELERLKEQFVSMISHELRTPLTSIIGYTELLIEGAAGELTSEQQRYLSVVLNNSQRQLSLVNDLLDLSRLTEGRLELNLTSVDVVAVARAVVLSLRPQWQAQALDVQVEVTGAVPYAHADNLRVNQIITNLVANAIKYTPRQGRITVRCSVEGGQPRVDVTDTGIGMSDEDQSRVFSRFFRSRSALAQAAAGTGLGLAITKALVEQQGGEIWFVSQPNVGSTFSFTLDPTA